ncbi:MAG TPA: UDP-N-acetylmuramate--L-alanine ligase [Anaerohalosphaeraceae bacterium]|jgi:UDP-N-acetylmuramate--alanine ligase|nr:UDP-N-acetylmuramate--L-alanine ligase [Anaerohalosphaeraceae bacterium]HRT50980.1 UDP-N-acetylmuramate--L-alanine ligase [Anaerohalosphaeraceae bacterium]HRT86966.1 UDP-N-acetylmuramate--L-alanine ligase [Anaerohalosphaeraceae bacterium]
MALSRLQVHPKLMGPDCEILTPPEGMDTPVAARRYHFIGAGGIGMSGLARLLVKNCAIVSGSDMEDSAVIRHLRDIGADIHTGHSADHLPQDLEAVVISAAIKESNPELAAARKKGCTIRKYAEMLGELMDCYDGIAVCGTHGKSTTSGWLAHLMTCAGADPSYIVGADIPQLGGSSGVGDSDIFIAEACEYDRSFLNLHPEIGVILNIEQDHLDYYRDEDEIVKAFIKFAQGIRPSGVLIVNGQDVNLERLLDALDDDRTCLTFGLDETCDFNARNIALVDGLYEFDVCRGQTLLGRTRISVPGRHNIFNALAVIAASITAGIETDKVMRFVGEFTGMDRRLMLKAQCSGIIILDDYAHHPTEIRASLEAIRSRWQPRRIWCVFQPHQYSRTRFLIDDFAESFKLADVTIVPEIYFVRDTEENKRLVNAEVLVDRVRKTGAEAIYINDFAGICEYLKAHVQSGDLVVTMGAGNVWKVADEYIQWLGKNRKD